MPSLEDLWPDLEASTEEPIPEVASQLLYETIKRHALCLCGEDSPKSPKSIHGRLHLMGRTDNDKPGDYYFDTVFIARTDIHYSESQRWQLIRFKVPRDRQIAFTDPDSESRQSALAHVQGFCHLVRLDIGVVKLCLRIKGDQLLNDHTPIQLGDAEYPIQPVPSVSLAQVLQMRHLTSRDKLIVAYILAKSVWHYYNTDWLNVVWTTDNIHFMIEEREGNQPEELTLNPARLYLAFADDETAKILTPESVDCCANHRYPRMLALGVILVELFCEKPRHSRRDNGTLDAFLNNSLHDNLRAMNKPSWPHLDLDATYQAHIRAAVAVCFGWERLESATSQSSDLTQAFHVRRDLLWDEVVSRLQRTCRVLRLVDETGAVIHGDSHTLDRIALYRTSFQQKRTVPATQAPESSSLVVLGPAPKTDEPAYGWLEKIQGSGLVRTLVRNSIISRSRPVRIAILDSGYDGSSKFLTDAKRRCIVAWHDFLKDSDNFIDDINPEEDLAQDSDGHGTDVLSLALRVAPFAEFCVARVFEKSGDVVSRSGEIAKAIKWAVEDLDVDIISMSFGFTEEQPDIRAAITEAHFRTNEQILFFAAAANEGANEPEMYPARDDRVFAIRASDHQGHWWKSNPPVDTDQHWSFMTLGQKLPSVTRDEIVSGTSYATPIAAGFAATILADARVSLTASTAESDMKLLNRLSRQDGMRRVFGKVSVETAPRCSYLNPMEFIRKEEDERLAILRYAK